jgi:hypothetical protein
MILIKFVLFLGIKESAYLAICCEEFNQNVGNILDAHAVFQTFSTVTTAVVNDID